MDDLPALPGYRIIERIGEGGMATVYSAMQLGLDRPVAVKFLTPELAAEKNFGKRFIREAHIVGRLSHAHIVPVYEAGEHNGQYWLSMEHLTGGDLRDAISAGLSESQKRLFLKQITQALGYAHQRGFVHRDIKPDNILLRDPETAVVTDFGIAREIAPKGEMTEITSVQTIIGSPKYMSPEQTRGEPLDARTDIYSLGVLAWQLLTGHPPHRGNTVIELAIQRSEKPVPELPKQLAHWQPLLNGLMANDRDQRFSDCDKVLQELARITRGSQAGPVSGTEIRYTGDATAIFEDPDKTRIAEDKPAFSLPTWVLGGLGVVAAASLAAYLLMATPKDSEVPAPASLPEALPTPPVALVSPTTDEYFAFRDALVANDGARFISRYSEGVLTEIMRAKAANTPAGIAAMQERAERGDPIAQIALSELYANGWGVTKDSLRARELAAAAARPDRPFANYHLASVLLAAAEPNEPASPRVVQLLESAAEANFFMAQTLLANLLFAGRTGDTAMAAENTERSLLLFEKAARQGDRNALYNLGQILQNGLGGVAPNSTRAQSYFQRAAALGHPELVN